MVFKTGETEIVEYEAGSECLQLLESEKSREHDSHITGIDFNPSLGLMVTCDEEGIVRLWNREKKFLREIQFPGPIDSIVFLNQEGDLLVSHEQRLSLVKLETYWTKVFDYYGVTRADKRDF